MTKTFQSLGDVPMAQGHYQARLPVTTDMDGMEIAVWTHVLVGTEAGPTLTLLSGLHGNEWLHLEFFRRFVQSHKSLQFRGRILVVPMANAVSFGQLSRSVPDDSDSPDTNRSFPGKGRSFTWIASQIADTIATRVLPSTDYLLDFHTGIWGSTMGSSLLGVDYSKQHINEESLALGLAFGNPLIFTARIVQSFPGPRSAQGYAGEVLGIPSCGSMLGGAGFDSALEEGWHKENLRGIYNVMIHVGMTEGEIEGPSRFLLYEMVHRLNPRNGGLLVPERNSEEFGREVAEGELLGRVVSPFSFEILEDLRVPVDGYLAYWSRTYPVRPGDWAFGVIPRDHPQTRWVDRPTRPGSPVDS